jgi:glucose/arabinose dehydrogenase/type 1 glutamine amidotransferase
MNFSKPGPFVCLFAWLGFSTNLDAQELGARWGTAERERAYYRIVELPTPTDAVIEAGAFAVLPDERVAVGTRRGDIYIVGGVDEEKPEPTYELFATGLDEIFGLAYRDGALYVTQSCELTRVSDTNDDGRADRFDTLSDAWGYENYHEYAFGSKHDADGNLYVALGLSQSYNSRALFRGWVLQVSEEGVTTPIASGLRSPAGIGPNEHGSLFYTESQGPWNSSCSLKALLPGGFMGHPISFNWYEYAPNMGPRPVEPKSGSRMVTEIDRVTELVPYAVIFPYIRMGRSISGFTLDRTGGRFGPFENQIFVGDFTLSLIMRATTEQVNGVWQGACYPFREGLSTGILDVQFTPKGNLLCGGTNRGWPVRGLQPFALERLDWTGVMPFEIERVRITSTGFEVTFTKPCETSTGEDTNSYRISTFTHIYHSGYGGPEVDQTKPEVLSVALSADGRTANLTLDSLVRGHVHELNLGALRARDGEELLHRHAYYTVNEIPKENLIPKTEAAGPPRRTQEPTPHPVPRSPFWLTYKGGEGPGQGHHIVLIAADQEYRSEQSMPMLARILSKHHGFHTTVLFALNEDGLVDPTQKIRWQDETVVHDIPGLEHLENASLVVFFNRLITLPAEQLRYIYDYLDTGRPIIGLRTANHGFLGFDYEKNGQRVRFGEDVLGGSFRKHHGRWHQDSTRGIVVAKNRAHPVLIGVGDIWGPTDVYRTYPEGGSLPASCLPLLLGQPLTGRNITDPPNRELLPLPVAWVKTWTGNTGNTARVFHSTMGSAKDFENAGLRRLTLNAVYWCLGMEEQISADSSVDIVGNYEPLPSGFDYEKLGVKQRPPGDF